VARALIPLLLVVAGCHAPPAGSRDATSSPLEASPDAGGRAVLVYDRSFGAEGEQPRALLLGAEGQIHALTDRAIYRLDGDGRVLARISLATLAPGTPRLISAALDGEGLGLTLRLPAGIGFALLDREGALAQGPSPIAAPTAEARGGFDGEAHRIVWTTPAPDGAGLELWLRSFTRAGGASPEPLSSALPLESTLGDGLAAPGLLAACTLDPGGQARLRRFSLPGVTEAPVLIGEPGREAIGACRLAWSGRAVLAATRTRALPPSRVDLGVRGVDLALGALSFDVPVARAVEDGAAGETVRLSLIPGTLSVESLIWDGARFLALTLAAGIAGGRLQLTLLDEAGRLLSRDLPLPLAYEPGSLSTACLAASPASGDYLLLYGSRRPWDEGVLHLVRFRLEGTPR
jgi:hypothetical protein